MFHKCLHPTLGSVYDTFLTKPRNFAVDMFIVFHTKRTEIHLVCQTETNNSNNPLHKDEDSHL